MDRFNAQRIIATIHSRLRRVRRLWRFRNWHAGSADSSSVLMLSDRDGPLHLYKQALDQVQPELLIGGDEKLAIP
jgi:hypothetical protein